MATELQAANELRRSIDDLARLANNDLAALWRDVATAAEARVALADILPLLIRTYGQAAAALAANWYDDLRDKYDVRGRFTAIPADFGDTGALGLAAGGTRALERVEDGLSIAQTVIYGGLQRRIANYARETITASAIADPGAEGWQRVGSGECAFCAMLIGRGAVYSENTADFGAHDHCKCGAVPAFGGRPKPVQPYRPSSRRVTPADRARVRAWIAANQ